MVLGRLIRSIRGFTLIELMAVLSTLTILVSLAVPSFSSIQSQFQLGEDTRRLTLVLGELRTEAIRLRTNVEIVFTSTGMSWDINDDGSTDGSIRFGRQTKWSSSIPVPIIFNGFGLARSIASTQSMSLKNRGRTLTVTVNKNGFISL